MWRCDEGLANFEPLYWSYLKDKGMYSRLSKLLTNESTSKTMATDLSTLSTFSMPKRQTLDKIFRPPRPKNTSERTANNSEAKQTSFCFSRLSSQPRVSMSPATNHKTEENKENLSANSNAQLVDHNASKVGTPYNRAKKEFMIRKASPSRSIGNDKSEIMSTDKPANLVKSSSVKYKNVVDQSRSVSNEVNLMSIINELPKISSKSWVVLDNQTKEALFGYKYSTKREIASLTKIMTLFTACKIIEDSKLNAKNFECSVSQNAASKIGTSANLKAGDKLSLYDLLFGTLASFRHDVAVGERCRSSH
jgi:hypothetical protein